MKDKSIAEAIKIFKEKNSEKKIKLKTKGKSMYPLIKDNSEIEVKVSTEKLKKGDIILYFKNKKFFVHRLLKKKGKKHLLKGDNNWDFDEITKEKNIIGKVEKINGKKTDSIGFELIKMPIIAYSYFTGIILEQRRKK